MTIVSSGAIRLSADIGVELGRSTGTQTSLGESAVRSLAGVATGAISMSNLYGKANQFSFTISTNQAATNLRTLALNAGWNGTSAVVATVASGVIIQQTSQGTDPAVAPFPSLAIDGSWPGGVKLINNGKILGRGGFGGSYNGSNSINGQHGGHAISLGVGVIIENNGIIAGGGGGGCAQYAQGSSCCYGASSFAAGGGGSGLGPAGTSTYGSNSNGTAGNNNTDYEYSAYGYGGSYGISGYDDCCWEWWGVYANGGAGGYWGANGSTGSGYGNPYGYASPAGSPGNAGKAVSLNGFAVTWTANGTRWGAIS